MEKDKDIKEADIEEEKKGDKVEVKSKKKGKNGAIYVVVCCIILLVFGAFVIALMNLGLVKFDGIDSNKSKATLKYTETNTKQKSVVSVIDVSNIVEDVMPSIVAITSKTIVNSGNYGPFFWGGNNGEQSVATGAGSGIIISQNDDEILILTNNHVIDGADELSVQFVDEKSVDATIKGSSEKNDVAVISVKLKDIDKETMSKIKIATMGDSNQLKVGNGIIAIGNALGYGQSVTTGVVSALNRELQGDDNAQKMIQIDAAINGGNSGGALLNSAGEVVGINSAKYSSNGYSSSASIEGMGFAIPISDVKELIEKLMNGQEVNEEDGKMGIEGEMVSSRNMPTGFYITKVEDGSGAEKAGLEVGYIITEVEGKEVTDVSVIKTAISRKNKGDKISIKVSYPKKNSYAEKDVEVKLS